VRQVRLSRSSSAVQPSERPDALWGEAPPGCAAGVENGAVVVEQAVREEALAQVKPDAFDGVTSTYR